MARGTPTSTPGRSRHWYVYALRDPLSWDVRYVGKTRKTPAARLRRHCVEAPGNTFHNARWICGLLKHGAVPLLEVLEDGTTEDGDIAAERKWIAEYRCRGAPLTNRTDGGDGFSGLVCSPETRLKLSKALSGRKHSPEHVEAAASAKRGQSRPAPAIEAQRAKMVGHVCSPATRKKMSDSAKGRKQSPEHVAKLAKVRKGRLHTLETKARMSATHTAKNAARREAAAVAAQAASAVPAGGTNDTS